MLVCLLPFSFNVLNDSHCNATGRLNTAVIFHTIIVKFPLNIDSEEQELNVYKCLEERILHCILSI